MTKSTTKDVTPPYKLKLDGRLEYLGISYWSLVILLVCTDILGPFATDAHLPTLPQMSTDLDCSPAWIQSTILSYTMILAFSQLLGGGLADLYGRRISTIIGLILFVLGNFGCVFSPNVVWLNMARIIQGVGAGMSTILSSVVARDIFEENERLTILGILGTIHPIAIASAPMFGGYVGFRFGWRMVFMSTAIFASFTLLLAIVKLPETKNIFLSPEAKAAHRSLSDINTFNTKIREHQQQYLSSRIGKYDKFLEKRSGIARNPETLLNIQAANKSHSSLEKCFDFSNLPAFQHDTAAPIQRNSPVTPDGAVRSVSSQHRVSPVRLKTKSRTMTPALQPIPSKSPNDHGVTSGGVTSGAISGASPGERSWLLQADLEKMSSAGTPIMLNASAAKHSMTSISSDGNESIVSTHDIDLTLAGQCKQSWDRVRYCWKMAFADRVFLLICIVLSIRLTGTFVFLNEFSFVFERNYEFNDTYDGLILGASAIFLTLGSTLAIALSNGNNSANTSSAPSSTQPGSRQRANTQPTPQPLKYATIHNRRPLKPGRYMPESPRSNSTVQWLGIDTLKMIRCSAIGGLIAGLFMILIPLIMYQGDFFRVYTAGGHEHNSMLAQFSRYALMAYDRCPWYLCLIPIYIFVGSDGLFNPPAMTIALEPYQHVAGTMASITGFFRIFIPSITVFIITQCISTNRGSTIIHMGVGWSGIISCILIFCIPKSLVTSRAYLAVLMYEGDETPEARAMKRRRRRKLMRAMRGSFDTDVYKPSHSPATNDVTPANNPTNSKIRKKRRKQKEEMTRAGLTSGKRSDSEEYMPESPPSVSLQTGFVVSPPTVPNYGSLPLQLPMTADAGATEFHVPYSDATTIVFEYDETGNSSYESLKTSEDISVEETRKAGVLGSIKNTFSRWMGGKHQSLRPRSRSGVAVVEHSDEETLEC